MPRPADAPALSVPEFARDLVLSQILEEDQINRLQAEAPAACVERADALAHHLVELGALTRFQAEKLLRGQWRSLVLGPYRLLSPLGRGGMGVVYLARGLAPDAVAGSAPLVALKVLPPQKVKAAPQLLTRFLREQEIGQRIPPHRGLARTLEGGVHAGVHYLAMEYVLGRTVRQVVDESGPIPVASAARVFTDIAAGLHVAHKVGLVHRDLKPSNVMITPDGGGKLLDFGLALILGEPSRTDPILQARQGYMLGTIDFMSPEQSADPTRVGPATDLYALGCSLYYAVTGSLPFGGGTVQDKIRLMRTSSAPLASQVNPAIPIELARLIARLMAKSPEGRPESAEQVAELLTPWAESLHPERLPSRQTQSTEALKQAEANWSETQQHQPAATPTSGDTFQLLDDDLIIVEDSPPVAAKPVRETYSLADAAPVESPTPSAAIRVATARRAAPAAAPVAEVPASGPTAPRGGGVPGWFPAAVVAAGVITVSTAFALGWMMAQSAAP